MAWAPTLRLEVGGTLSLPRTSHFFGPEATCDEVLSYFGQDVPALSTPPVLLLPAPSFSRV